MKKNMFGLLTFIFLLLAGGVSAKDKVMINSVENVDLARYSGVWYEIARLPNTFERNLVGVTATYTIEKTGKIGVLNQGYRDSLDGKLVSIKGRARVPDPAQPGRLKVAFFLFFGADYFILELDTSGYQYALVGGASKNILWILGRTPGMEDTIYQSLVEKARSLGYDTERLIKVPQN